MKSFNSLLSAFMTFIIFCFLTFYTSCRNEDTVVNCVPPSYVEASYNLDLPLFANLRQTHGYVVLEPDGTNGSRGIIIVNTGSRFVAYDRNAPHICPSANSTLVVKDDIIIECPEDGAQWMLYKGEPLNEQTNGRTPRQFYVNLIGSDLIITN
ncbi:MAG: hypothetical protein ACR2MS_05055 [Weeksellaceae bacterium]